MEVNQSMPETILQAIDEASEWLDIQGVEGVGQGDLDGKECLVVHVSVAPTELSGMIPATFKGFPVVMEESGIISAQ